MKYQVVVEGQFHDCNLFKSDELTFMDGSPVKRTLQPGDKLLCTQSMYMRLKNSEPTFFQLVGKVIPKPKKPVKAKKSDKS